MPTTREFKQTGSKTKKQASKPISTQAGKLAKSPAGKSAKSTAEKASPAKRTNSPHQESFAMADELTDVKISARRRPGREDKSADEVVDLKSDQKLNTKRTLEFDKTETLTAQENEMQDEKTTTHQEDLAAEFEATAAGPKVEINFKGSELLRARFPKPFEVAEAVASDWVSEGKFDQLPITHPLTNWAAQQGLLKAKELEKKVVESPAVEKAAMTALTVAMKAQGVFEQLRSRIKRP